MKKIFYLLPLLFLTACAPHYSKHEASVIVFKTPTMAFADAGFVHDNGSEMKIVILVVGQAVFTLELGRKICLDGLCWSKKKFIAEKLNSKYPRDILQNIFLGKAIFKAQNLERFTGGFSQKIFKKGLYDISYKVEKNSIRFKDKISKILIKTRKISQEEKK